MSSVIDFLRRHPKSVSGVYLFAFFMTFVYMPYDVLLKPLLRGGVASAEEVWLGYMLTGWAAKLTEPLHWAIYAGLAYGFTRERPWAWTFAALYTLQVAVGSVIWVVLYASYGPFGYVMTVVVVGLFVALAAQVCRAHPHRSRLADLA